MRCLFHFYGNIAKEFQVLIIVLQAWQRLMKNDTKKCWVWKHLNKILSNKTLYVASTIRGTSKVELRFKPCAYYHTIVLMIFHGFFCNALSYSMQRYIQHSIHKCHHDIFVHCWILYYMTHQGAPSHTHSGKLNMFFYVWKWSGFQIIQPNLVMKLLRLLMVTVKWYVSWYIAYMIHRWFCIYSDLNLNNPF